MQNTQAATILVAQTDPDVGRYFQVALEPEGYFVERTPDRARTLSVIQSCKTSVDAVLLDVSNDCDVLGTLREIRQNCPGIPVILLSDTGAAEDIARAMKLGAADVLLKPVAHDKLRTSLRGALDRGAPPAGEGRPTYTRDGSAYFGNNPAMRRVQALIGKIAWSEAPVLIQGETGTGKEVLARELHARSPRASKPFLKLNCAALPAELIESELFGYERGAFTGALRRKTGIFENTAGGTLLLDEIGDMEFRLQSKLLHVLQDSSFLRVGGKEAVNVDVRIMAATHCNLEQSIAAHNFREDLFYRLNVINVRLPPLREQKEDILDLTKFLIRKHGTAGAPTPPLTPMLEQALLGYHWPGNIRELENCVRKFLVFRDAEMIVFELQAKLAARRPLAGQKLSCIPKLNSGPGDFGDPISDAEVETIIFALNATYWNRRKAAALLNMDYRALLCKIGKLGIGRKAQFAGSAGMSEATDLH